MREPAVSVSDEQKLGQRLQAARQAAGLTQQTLCQKAGLSYSTLAKIERGAIKTPSVFTIQSIAGVLGISLDQLVGAPPATGSRPMRSRSGVRFVYFDVNGCLARFYYRAFTDIGIDCDLPSDVVETTFWHYNDRACRGDMTMAEFNMALGKRLHLPDFDWPKYYLGATEPTPKVAELVAWVRERYGVGLLTNTMAGLVPSMLQRALIPDVRYDAIIDSSEAHLLKPERAIYELAEKRADCKPEEILFVDDTRANLMAAEKLGWHVMWFDDSRPEESIARVREALEPAAA